VDTNAAGQLRRGRDAFRRGAWEEAFSALTAAAQGGALESQDMDVLADCAHYTGRTDRCAEILYGQHAGHLAAGRVEAAAMAAYRLHMLFSLNGEAALAAGWLGRAARALVAVPDCVACGYVALAEAEGAYWRGEVAESLDAARRARVLGERHVDWDVTVVAVHLEGRALVRLHELPEGLRLLDEAMAAAAAGELSPFYAVWVYCSSIITCHARADIRRAAEWTAAFERWSRSHAPAPMFSGTCHLHRGEIKQLRGAWAEAEQENRRAVALLRGLVAMDAAQASYHLGELHRLRGDYEAAEAAFAEVGHFGGDVQPGLSLLRHAQGRSDAAVAGLRRALAEPSRDAMARARLLPAAVEIGLAHGDVATARADADELSATATAIGTAAMRAVAAFSNGAVQLAEGSPGDALGSLRMAERLWGELDVPYERARARQLIGMACRAAGDEDAATLDLWAARRVFTDLGAVPDIAEVDRLLSAGPARPAALTQNALTPREVEVLRLVATGKTNHAVASQLHLSERTVARHLSNIFAKTGVESRAAATAYAYRNQLA
jgi:DNA-binding CsgD family transcriptional regulator/tetratricopeptide (TPR) repeat protein